MKRKELNARFIDRCPQGVKTEKGGNTHRHSERHLNMNMTKKLSKHHSTSKRKLHVDSEYPIQTAEEKR